MKFCRKSSILCRKRNPWRGVSIASLIVICSFLGCGNQHERKAELRIGVIAPMTGEHSDTGRSTLEAANMAVRVINEAGGLTLGGKKHEVVLLVEDNQDIPEVAVDASRKLIYQENVVALVGLNVSRNAIPVASICENARIPMISTASTNPETTLGKKYVFRAIFLDDFQARILANFVHGDLGFRKAAVLYDIASIYNRELAEVFKQVFEQKGGRVVAFESYTSDENQDFSPQLERIRDGKAEVLFLPNYYHDVLIQTKQARQIGVHATFLGGDSWGQLGAEAFKDKKFKGSFFCNNWDNSSANSQSQAFMEAYQRAYERDPKGLAALTYDSFGLLFQAMQSQGKTDPESIRNGLANIRNYKGVSGNISYLGSGDPAKSAAILQIQDGEAKFYRLIHP